VLVGFGSALEVPECGANFWRIALHGSIFAFYCIIVSSAKIPPSGRTKN
jgi:hypothetical protein